MNYPHVPIIAHIVTFLLAVGLASFFWVNCYADKYDPEYQIFRYVETKTGSSELFRTSNISNLGTTQDLSFDMSNYPIIGRTDSVLSDRIYFDTPNYSRRVIYYLPYVDSISLQPCRIRDEIISKY